MNRNTMLRNDDYAKTLRRLGELKEKINAPEFISSKRKANEVNSWVFDYPPEQELTVREYIGELAAKNNKYNDSFQIYTYDLYDIIIDFLESEEFIGQCDKYEQGYGIGQVASSIKTVTRVNMEENLFTEHIRAHTPPEKAVVFLTGVGKCYPMLQANEVFNKIQYNMPAAYNKVPMIVFYPGTYTEQELILFNKIHEANYYRAFRIVRD
ncbi:MAG: DUF1788 domain-containing protein [Anaerovibrio sp.]